MESRLKCLHYYFYFLDEDGFHEILFADVLFADGVEEVAGLIGLVGHSRRASTMSSPGRRRTLPGNGNVVSRDQVVDGGISSFAGEVPALGRGDTDQIGP
jgi:hypothetical protein